MSEGSYVRGPSDSETGAAAAAVVSRALRQATAAAEAEASAQGAEEEGQVGRRDKRTGEGLLRSPNNVGIHIAS